ncbi:MAG TPA: hypothetical protein VEF35_07915 [Candidatus Bathyarchaeia archaeon]|nr:hypothetical protein [Candidatus Bathyarchaeia archaeon]
MHTRSTGNAIVSKAHPQPVLLVDNEGDQPVMEVQAEERKCVRNEYLTIIVPAGIRTAPTAGVRRILYEQKTPATSGSQQRSEYEGRIQWSVTCHFFRL